MVFTSLTIKEEAEEVDSTMTKVASYWSTGQFEKSMKTNLRKLKSGVGVF